MPGEQRREPGFIERAAERQRIRNAAAARIDRDAQQRVADELILQNQRARAAGEAVAAAAVNMAGNERARRQVIVGPEYFYEGHAVRCASCGARHMYTIPQGQVYADGTRIRCRACANYQYSNEYLTERRAREDAERARRALREPAQIHNYTFKPTPKMYGKDADGLFFGIELEVEAKRDYDPSDVAWEIYESMEAQKGLFYFKRDGSLVHGFEMVTHPMSFTYAMKNWPAIAVDLIAQKTQNHWEGNYQCGIHIHMSRDAFGKAQPKTFKKGQEPPPTRTDRWGGLFENPVARLRPSYHLYKFTQFIYNNAELVKRIAGREGCVIHGTEMASYNKADLVEYITRDAKGELYNDVDRGLREAAKGKPVTRSRYVAVNLLNKNTIELRIFRSTTNHRRLRAYIQFADALFHYSKKAHIHSKHAPERAMSAKGYEDYVRAHPTRYEDLIAVFNNDPALAV